MPLGDVNNLSVRVQLDGVGEANRELAKLEQRGIQTAQRIGRSMSQVGRALTVGVTAPILAVGAVITKLGIDAAEARSLIQTSFGEMATAATAWADTSSAAIIQTRLDVQEQAALLFNVARGMGVAKDAAFELSTGFVDMAADFASFYNLRPDEAIDKVRAALVGEYEPLKAIGIVLDADIIKIQAYNDGLAAQGAELTVAEKAQARYNAIMQRAGAALGDVERTAGGAANVIRAMQARIKEAGQEMGESFLPVVADFLDKYAIPLVTKISEAATAFSEMDEAQQRAYFRMAGAAAIAGPAMIALGEVTKTVALLALALRGVQLAAIAAWAAVLGPIAITAGLVVLAEIQGGPPISRSIIGVGGIPPTRRQRTEAERLATMLGAITTEQRQLEQTAWMVAEYNRALAWIAAQEVTAGPPIPTPRVGGGGGVQQAVVQLQERAVTAASQLVIGIIDAVRLGLYQEAQRMIQAGRPMFAPGLIGAPAWREFPPGYMPAGQRAALALPTPPFPGFPTYGGRGAFDVIGAEGLMFPMGAGAGGGRRGARPGLEGWGGADWATLAGVGVGAYQAGGGGAAMGAMLPMIGSAFGPWGTLAGVVLGGLFGRGGRPDPIIEPIPVKVINWADMESAFLKITQGLLRRGVGAGIDDLVERLRMKEVQVGLE